MVFAYQQFRYTIPYFGIRCETPSSVGANLSEPLALELGTKGCWVLSSRGFKPFPEVSRVQFQGRRGNVKLFSEDVKADIWLHARGGEDSEGSCIMSASNI